MSKRSHREAPGKVKSEDGEIRNLIPQAKDTKPITSDGVKEALEMVSATMHTISSKPQSSQVELGPVPMAELQLEGSPMKALLDTGSPVTKVSLGFLLDALAKKR